MERRSGEADDGFGAVGGMRPLLRGGGPGPPYLLIHPAGATASTWGSVTEALARLGRVLTYDRRGDARSGDPPGRLVSTHTADAAAMLASLGAPPAVVVGTSAGAGIAIDLSPRRPDLVQVVIAPRRDATAARRFFERAIGIHQGQARRGHHRFRRGRAGPNDPLRPGAGPPNISSALVVQATSCILRAAGGFYRTQQPHSRPTKAG